VHEETKQVESLTICVPFILNSFLNTFSVKNLNFLSFLEERNKWYSFMHDFRDLLTIAIFVDGAMLTYNWKQVDWVLYFINGHSSHIFSVNWIELFFWEYLFVVVSNVEEIAIVSSNFNRFIRMVRWPLVIVKLYLENIAFIANKFADVDSFFHHGW